MTDPVFNSCLKECLHRYFDFCRKSFTYNTCRQYQVVLCSFDRYLCSIGWSEMAVTETVINEWIASVGLRTDRTTAGYLGTIRRFLDFATGFGIRAFIPDARKVGDSYNPYIFSDEEIEKIFSFADNYKVFIHNKLPYIQLEFPMILRILCGCGTRLDETLSIKMDDVDLENGIIVLRHTKWSRERQVPLHPGLADILRKYCMRMGLVGKSGAYLFPRHSFDEHVLHFDMRNRFNTLLRMTGIELPDRKFQERGPCMHCFRHHFVLKSFKQLEDAGIRIDDVTPYLSVYLGHYDLSETEKYMKFSAQLFPEELELFENLSDNAFPDFDEEGWS